ncbi:MAG: PAS domain S-box protein, partial [Acidobacteriaceae bacterium]
MKLRRSRNDPAASAQSAAAAPQLNDGDAASSEPRVDILRALVDNLDEAVVVLGRDGTVRFANAAAERLYGIKPQGAPISGWSEAYGIYLPDRQTLWPADELPGAVALKGRAIEGEQYVRPPGASAGYWIEVRARPLFAASGEVDGALLAWRDISDEKRTAENQRRLLAIVENSPDLVSLTDPTLKTSFINQAGRELLGLTDADDVRRFPVFDTDFENQREVFDSEILPVLLRGEPWYGEFRLRHARTGEAITVDMRAFGIFGPYGQLLGFASISRDITARRQAEEARQRLASIVEFSYDAIISESLDGIVVTWNRGAEMIFGYMAAEMIGEPITRLAWPGYEDDMRELLRRIGTEDIVERYETLRRHKDGRCLVVSLTLSPVRDDSGRLIGISKIAR